MGVIRRQLDTLVDSETGNFAGFVDGDGTIRYVPGMDVAPAAGASPAMTSADANGNTVLVDPLTGALIPIGGDSVLSSTVLILGATTIVNVGAIIPFGEASRNDLNLDYTTSSLGAGVLALPSNMSQFRFGYHLKFNGASTGLPGGATSGNRRALPNIISGGVPEIETLLGVHEMTLQYPGIGAGDQSLVWTTTDNNAGVLHYQSPWIDVASLATAPSGVVDDDLLYLTLVHNAGANALSCLLGSSMWLETMTPA